MTKAMDILRAAGKYNPTDDFLRDAYGMPSDMDLDAIVLAPSWMPEKILPDVQHECLRRGPFYSTWVVELQGNIIGWIQCGNGASNLIDAAISLAQARAPRLLFVGAVGGLRAGIAIGDIATPLESLAYEGSSLYLRSKLDASRFGESVRPHDSAFIDAVIRSASEKGIEISRKKTFCTDSLVCEYMHLPEILETGAELIEMETAAFYRCAQMLEKPAMAILCVSDNSATGGALLGRSEEDTRRFYTARHRLIPQVLEIACKIPV